MPKVTAHLSLLICFVLAGVLLGARPALADPHAIFYTAIGQEQLFFNVLASLNQADYVEPPVDATFGRNQLVERRGEVDVKPRFTAEESDLINRTKTDLSAIVTRPITLEGNDLYTDQLVRQLAAQRVRQGSLAEIARAACDYVLGLRFCKPEGTSEGEEPGDGDPGAGGAAREAAAGDPEAETDPQQAAVDAVERKKGAINDDPVEKRTRLILDGSWAVLDSGSEQDNRIRAARMALDEQDRTLDYLRQPRAHSPWIHRNRVSSQGTGDPSDIALYESLIASVKAYYLQDGLVLPNGNIAGGHPLGQYVVSAGSSSGGGGGEDQTQAGLSGILPVGQTQPGSSAGQASVDVTFVPRIKRNPATGMIETVWDGLTTDEYVRLAARGITASSDHLRAAEGGTRRLEEQFRVAEEGALLGDIGLGAASEQLGGSAVVGNGQHGELFAKVITPPEVREQVISQSLNGASQADATLQTVGTKALTQRGQDSIDGDASQQPSTGAGGIVQGSFSGDVLGAVAGLEDRQVYDDAYAQTVTSSSPQANFLFPHRDEDSGIFESFARFTGYDIFAPDCGFTCVY